MIEKDLGKQEPKKVCFINIRKEVIHRCSDHRPQEEKQGKKPHFVSERPDDWETTRSGCKPVLHGFPSKDPMFKHRMCSHLLSPAGELFG